MNGGRMTFRQGQALARFIHELRGDWDVPGIESALGQVHDKAPADVIACAAVRAATVPSNRTPAVIAFDGPHWRTTPDAPRPHFDGPTAAERCSVCSQRRDRCESQWSHDHQFVSAATVAGRKADAEQAKAITDALRAEVQPLRDPAPPIDLAERRTSKSDAARAAIAQPEGDQPA